MLSGYIIIDDAVGMIADATYDVPNALMLKVDPIKQKIGKARVVKGVSFTDSDGNGYVINSSLMIPSVGAKGDLLHFGLSSITFPNGHFTTAVLADIEPGVILAVPIPNL